MICCLSSDGSHQRHSMLLQLLCQTTDGLMVPPSDGSCRFSDSPDMVLTLYVLSRIKQTQKLSFNCTSTWGAIATSRTNISTELNYKKDINRQCWWSCGTLIRSLPDLWFLFDHFGSYFCAHFSMFYRRQILSSTFRSALVEQRFPSFVSAEGW